MPAFWDLTVLTAPPPVQAAKNFSAPDVQGLFFESVPFHSQPTRVFAWMGIPKTRPGHKIPGMLLLHGGGGTAFDEWVRVWNRRGYAAIAMDLCGCIPEQPVIKDGGATHQRLPDGGPAGWDNSFDQANEPVEDQWTYHAVAASLRAYALLTAQPTVDGARIGVTGISWGGYLTAIVAGVNPLLTCAIPVYGCGFLGHNSHWNDLVFPGKDARTIKRWLDLWDPSAYLPAAKLPMCWVTGTNDFAYPLDSLQKSYLLPPGERTLCIRPEMAHGHEPGWSAPEIGVFADAHLNSGRPLPRILAHGRSGNQLWLEYQPATLPAKAEIVFTRACGQWQDRKYNIAPATIQPAACRAEATIPAKTTTCYLNLTDERGCIASTPHFEL
jgi:dienelactone hydrolase